MTATVEEEINANIARMEAAFQEELEAARYARRNGGYPEGTEVTWLEPTDLTAGVYDNPGSSGPIGSESWLLDHEDVCPVTNLTYYAEAGCPHHYYGGEACAHARV